MRIIVDWLKNISAGSILIGLYQNSVWAWLIGFATLIYALYLNRRIK